MRRNYTLTPAARSCKLLCDAKRELEIYQKLKETKEKLRALYKELQVQPKEIRADEPDEKNEPDEK